jgi:hypothetical protein
MYTILIILIICIIIYIYIRNNIDEHFYEYNDIYYLLEKAINQKNIAQKYALDIAARPDSKDKTIVVGVRTPRNDSKLRVIYSSLFGLVYKLLFRIFLSDPSSPFIAVFKKDIEFIVRTEVKLDYGFWWEFQARVAHERLKIKEIPVNHRKRVDGKTQVYVLNKLVKIVVTHLAGLLQLKKELDKSS